MEDFEVIRRFVTESDFEPQIKQALMDSIALEAQGKPLSDYQALVRKMADQGNDEN